MPVLQAGGGDARIGAYAQRERCAIEQVGFDRLRCANRVEAQLATTGNHTLRGIAPSQLRQRHVMRTDAGQRFTIAAIAMQFATHDKREALTLGLESQR